MGNFMKKLTWTHKSLILRMLSILLTCIAVISVSSLGASGQTVGKKITIDKKNTSVRQIIYELRKQSGMNFMFEDSQIDKMAPKTLQLKNVSVEKALDELLKDTGYTYKITGNSVAIVRKVENKQVEGHTVSGIIMDENGEPLVGATVVLKGTTRGVVADAEGAYSIHVPSNITTLEVSFLGYQKVEVIIGHRTEINLKLKPDSRMIEDVVVTGYQTISKERATGAYSIVGAKVLEQKPTVNISSALNGLVPGLAIENSPVEGSARFIIRGKGSLRGYQEDSDPLIVVDGFPISGYTESNDPFETINPNDVESITVLKDAAATSIYGARAANGVIVITTKKGKSDKLDISAGAYWAVSSRVDLDYLFNMASAENQFRYVELMHGYNAIPSGSDPYSDPRYHRTYMSEPRRLLFERDKGNITIDEYNKLKKELIELGNRKVWKDDLNDYVFRHALRSQYNVALRGMNQRMNYAFSGSYDGEKGYLKGNDKQRMLLNINTSTKLTKNLTFDVTLNSSFAKQQNRGTSAYSGLQGYISPWSRFVGDNGEFIHVPTSSTVYEAILESDYEGKTPADWHYNPIKDRQYIDDESKVVTYRIQGGFEYSTTWGLKLGAKGQYESRRYTTHLAYDPESYYVRDYYNTYSTQNGITGMFESYFPRGGVFTDAGNEYEAYNLRGQADYNYLKDKNALSVLAGTEVLSSTTETRPSITRYGYNKYTNAVLTQPDYISDVITIFDRESGAKTKMPYEDLGTLSTYEDRFFSIYANAVYTYNERYSLTGSFRTDASNFQSQRQRDKFSPFWSVGASWLVSRENFMQQVSWVDLLKLRASLGIAGVAAGKSKISSVTTLNTRPGNILFNKGESFNDISYPGNETLTWEKSRTLNIGLDMELFNHKLSGCIEFYNKYSYDVLSYATVPTISQGKNSVMYNNAKVLNRGVELSLNTDLRVAGDLKWRGVFNYSYNNNKVKAFYENTPISPQMPGLIEGYPMGVILVLKPSGYTPEGYIKLQGKDGTREPILDNVSSHTSDRILRQNGETIGDNNWFYYLGTSTPKSQLSFSNQFTWKGMTLSFMITGRFGYYVRRGDEFTANNPGAASFSKRLDRAFTVYDAGYGNQTSYSEYPLYNDENYQLYQNIEKNVSDASQMFVTNYIKGDHIRLNEVYWGYDLPEWLLSRQNVFKRINVYVQVSNLGILWSKNKDMDPDYRVGTIKPMSTFMFGLKVNFRN